MTDRAAAFQRHRQLLLYAPAVCRCVPQLPCEVVLLPAGVFSGRDLNGCAFLCRPVPQPCTAAAAAAADDDDSASRLIFQ